MLEITRVLGALATQSASGDESLQGLVKAALPAVGIENLQIAIQPATQSVHASMRLQGRPYHTEISFDAIESFVNDSD